MNDNNNQPQTTNKKLNLSLDLRWIIGLLLVVIVGMLFIWQPWDSPVSDRIISVTGQATVSAEPDEYVFNPSYNFDGTDKQASLDDMTAKSNEIVDELKQLGVEDNQIKTNSGGHEIDYFRAPDPGSDQFSYSLRLTVTVTDEDLAQEVQDYLVSTEPSGSVTPYVTFSDSARTELESQARDQATKDARKKADQSAENLGFTVGAVKTVTDGPGFGVFPVDELRTQTEDGSTSQLQLQPGENDVNYSVTVVFYVE